MTVEGVGGRPLRFETPEPLQAKLMREDDEHRESMASRQEEALRQYLNLEAEY